MIGLCDVGCRGTHRERTPRWRGALLVALLALLAVPPARTGARVYAQAPGQGYTPAQILKAYNILPLSRRGVTGRGQTIAFIEVDGLDQEGLDYFDRAFGLPGARPDIYVPQGVTQALDPGPETTLDVEWAHAIAPAARLQIYEATRVGDFKGYSGQLAALVEAALANGATDISMSLRGTGSVICSTLLAAARMHGAFQDAAARGVTVFAASGDYGYRPCQSRNTVGSVYPASDPDVTAVGGTALALAPGGGYGGETAWSGSGGGYSVDFPRPSWQRGLGDFTTRYRSVPDVAFDAAQSTGVLVRLGGAWDVVGGTSVGAPCWAAIWALAEQDHKARTGKGLAPANPLLYALANSSLWPTRRCATRSTATSRPATTATGRRDPAGTTSPAGARPTPPRSSRPSGRRRPRGTGLDGQRDRGASGTGGAWSRA